MQVMDYVDYPKSYSSIPTSNPENSEEKATSIYNGWRVTANYIDEDGSKKVRITTAGVPEEVTIAKSDFEASNLDGPYSTTINAAGYNQTVTGYELKNLREYGKEYYLEQYASSYSVLGLFDSYRIYNSVGCNNDLVLNEGYYFVNAYNEDQGGLGYVSPSSYNNYTLEGGTSGIRPVVILRNDKHIYKLWDDENERYYWKFAD